MLKRDGSVRTVLVPTVVKWTAYKPKSPQAKRGIEGRWQESNGYGGWDNCDFEPDDYQEEAEITKAAPPN